MRLIEMLKICSCLLLMAASAQAADEQERSDQEIIAEVVAELTAFDALAEDARPAAAAALRKSLADRQGVAMEGVRQYLQEHPAAPAAMLAAIRLIQENQRADVKLVGSVLEARPDRAEKIKLIQAMGGSKSPAMLDVLAPWLRDSDLLVARAARNVVLDLAERTRRSDRLVFHLGNLRRSSEMRLRSTAVHLLRQISSQRATEELVRALQDDQPVIRTAAIKALVDRRIGWYHQMELIALFDRDEKSDILAVCEGLADLRSGAAVPAIARLLNHMDDQVRTAAHKALQRISGQKLPPERSAWMDWYRKAEAAEQDNIEKIRSLPADASVTRTVRLLRDAMDNIIYPEQSADAVATLLQHPRMRVRKMACGALGKMRIKKVARSLLPLLVEPELSDAAHQALVEISGRSLPKQYEVWYDWIENNHL